METIKTPAKKISCGSKFRCYSLFAICYSLFFMSGCNRDPQYYYEEGNRQASAGRFADAVENYNQAIILKKGFPEALTSRGLIYEKTGDRQKAIFNYKKAIAAAPAYMPAYNNLSALYLDEGNLHEASKYLTSAIELSPDYAYARLNRGILFYRKGDCAAAVSDLSRVIAGSLETPSQAYGSAVPKAHGPQNGQSSLLQKTAENTSMILAFYHRGLCYRKTGNFTGALSDFGSLLALDKKFAPAWFESGRTRFSVGDYPGAVNDFYNASGLKTEIYGYQYALAKALIKLGNYNEALAYADKALALKNDYAPACALKGDIFVLINNKAAAREQYLKAAQLSPENAAFYRARASAFEEERPKHGPKKRRMQKR
ncbi:MAG: hypothetical protein A2X34_04330 [Elusimicrobia bacterium GWC2_51_8]|nr:MAG: hypothetical protein A2X33_03650 [Elusimicrobia bacterium GWA2_51_34]OGR59850.1 MAG: hypothetical protein A2X34_04330 [Elusimicrobia bacterium GWC2_51_8]OGR88062.1 MAG: hypothetical protein A2021_06965 [Elusimicrobia bacterium GWF2_52_66]HAF95769.1 hypothetical protein [Elusimicrobiota bacterium]HCE99186.1 hypothetical protein [Elusimicrobiota bacterium]